MIKIKKKRMSVKHLYLLQWTTINGRNEDLRKQMSFPRYSPQINRSLQMKECSQTGKGKESLRDMHIVVKRSTYNKRVGTIFLNNHKLFLTLKLSNYNNKISKCSLLTRRPLIKNRTLYFKDNSNRLKYKNFKICTNNHQANYTQVKMLKKLDSSV